MIANVQTIGVRDQLERIRIGDGQRRHIGGGQRVQHTVDDMQNLANKPDTNRVMANGFHQFKYTAPAYLLLAQLVAQLHIRSGANHHRVVDPDVILIVFPAFRDVQRWIAVHVGGDAVAQVLQIEHGRGCERKSFAQA